MSGSYSYPGIYIQELPSNSHAIVPAPTSIAAFIGYSHPYKTASFGVAQQIFSFSDYETYFGGLFSSGLVDASLARAVYQFFLNGGSNAYVVGLQPGLFNETAAAETIINRLGPGPGGIAPFSSNVAATGGGFHFVAREPIDVIPISVTITNLRNAGKTFDIVITYGTQVETYRGVTIPIVAGHAAPTDPDVMINGVSSLVTIVPSATGFGSAVTTPIAAITWTDVSTTAAGFETAYNGADFLPVFDSNSSLDNVEIFNLLMIPGVTDNLVVSAALAFAERKKAFAIIDPPPQAPAAGVAGVHAVTDPGLDGQPGSAATHCRRARTARSTSPICNRPTRSPARSSRWRRRVSSPVSTRGPMRRAVCGKRRRVLPRWCSTPPARWPTVS